MSDLERLHELQLTDSALDHMAYRRAHLDERIAFDKAHRGTETLRSTLTANVARRAELDRLYAAIEAAGREIDSKAARLEGQMRNVVVTREAEAIQREIGLLHAKREAGDEEGLVLLDESETLSAAAADLEVGIEAAAGVEASAAVTLAAADAVLDGEVVELTARRKELASGLPAGLLAEYEARRPRFKGQAVAKLQGTRCSGCHLDLSRVEIEALRAVPDSEFPECPQCARIIVR
jgi:hypothetical protein